MRLQKMRWSKVYESSEEELVDFLKARGINTDHKVLAEFESAQEAERQNEITVWCAEGSFSLNGQSETLSMQPGDAVRIPASTPIDISAGISGCIYYVS